LARRLEATVTGLHVVDIVSIEGSFLPDISGSLGFEPYLDFTSKMREARHERGKAILDEFSATCREAGVRFDTALQIGIVPSEIVERAREADLVVIGHRGINQRFSTGLLGGVTESVTRQCSKPVLVTPLEFAEIRSPPSRLRRERARAAPRCHVAAEVCHAARTSARRAHGRARCRAGREDDRAGPGATLASYSLQTATFVVTGHAYEKIPGEIRARGYDLLFMGAHGHGASSRWCSAAPRSTCSETLPVRCS
jgi:nucleotide-binding universal stress UspA family protein